MSAVSIEGTRQKEHGGGVTLELVPPAKYVLMPRAKLKFIIFGNSRKAVAASGKGFCFVSIFCKLIFSFKIMV